MLYKYCENINMQTARIVKKPLKRAAITSVRL